MAGNEGTNPLAKTFVNISLTGGLNRKRDAHQLQNGELLSADNVSYSQVDGQICKRNGFAPVMPFGAPFQGGPFKAIGIRDNIEPLILGTNTLNKYNVAQNLSTSLPTPTQGRVSVLQLTGSSGRPVLPTIPADASIATDGQKYLFAVWQENNTPNGALCYYGVQDIATGAWIIKPTSFQSSGTATGPNQFGQNVTYTYTALQNPIARYCDGFFQVFYLWGGKYTVSGASYYGMRIAGQALVLTNLSAGLGPINFGVFMTYSGVAPNMTTPQVNAFDVDTNGTNYAASFLAAGDNKLQYATGTITPTSSTIDTPRSLTLGGPSANYNRTCIRRTSAFANPTTAVGVSGGFSIVQQVNPTLATTNTVIFPTGAQALPFDMQWFTQNNATNLYATWVSSDQNITSLVWLGGWDVNGTQTLLMNYTLPVLSSYTQILSKVFMIAQSKRFYVWVGAGGSSSDAVYSNAYLIEFNPDTNLAQTVCRTLYTTAAHITSGEQMSPCEVINVPKTSRWVTLLSARSENATLPNPPDGLVVPKGLAFGTLNRVTFDFAPNRGSQIIPLPSGGNFIAGAYPLYYDGVDIVEAGFSSVPTGDKMVNSLYNYSQTPTVLYPTQTGIQGGPSAITPSGSIEYYYAICFVRRDAYGNVYRSAPSPIITVSFFQTGTSQVRFPRYFSYGGGNVMIEFYRSTQDTPGTYYFIGQTPNGTEFIDLTPDGSTALRVNTSITKNRTLYINASELANDPPPPVHHAVVSETRMYIIPSDNRNLIWYSKLFSPGRTVEFNAGLTLSEGQNNGLFTGLAVLDSNLIIFKADSILYTHGAGPDNTGRSGTFAPFEKISSDVGCIEAASIATIPDGIVFKSRRGIELLTRGLQVVYIGGNVEPLVQTNGPLSSVVCMPNFTELRFVPAQSSYDSTYLGVTTKVTPSVLVFDYGAKRWSTFSNMAAVQAVNLNNEYWWISADGSVVNKETPGIYLDNGKPIVMTLETPEIPCGGAGAQGWGRIYRMALMGDFYQDHSLLVQFAYDHQANYKDSVTFNTTSGLIPGDIVYQFRCSRLPRSVMQTLRLKIQDSVNTGPSCAISNLVLEMASKNGLAHLSPAKTL